MNALTQNLPKVYHLRIAAREISHAVLHLHFAATKPMISYLSGQYITLCLPVDNKEIRRCYSLYTVYGQDKTLGIAIKRLSGGIASAWLWQHAFPGKVIKILAPQGKLIYSPALNHTHIGILAGGVGITPLFSILKSILIKSNNQIIKLLYANRHSHDILFYKELTALQEQYKHRLTCAFAISRPNPNTVASKLNETSIQNYFEDMPNDTLFYLCAPQSLMQKTQNALLKQGFKTNNIHQELFTSDTQDIIIDTQTKAYKMQIVLDDQEHNIVVAPSETILEAGLAHGLDMPYSCQMGVCGTCRGQITNKDKHHKIQSQDKARTLSEEDKQEGYILCCQSKPLGDNVKISMD